MKSRFVSLAGALALLATSSVVAQDGKITEGRLDAIGADGRPLGACPLKHTSVEAENSGTLARVSATAEEKVRRREEGGEALSRGIPARPRALTKKVFPFSGGAFLMGCQCLDKGAFRALK